MQMQTVRIATLNIWNRSGPWEERLAAIRELTQQLSPDVLGLQEVLHPLADEGPDQAALIADGLGYSIAFAPAWDAGGIEFGNAALSRFPILHHETIPLPDGGTSERRCMLHAQLDTPWGVLPFFVTHLNWRFHEGYVREAQVKRIAEAVRERAPIAGLPPVLVGDFNVSPDSDEVRYLRGLCSLGTKGAYFADAFAVAGDGSAGATYCRRNPFAAELCEPDRRIDYVFVRGPDVRRRGEPIEARLCFDRPVGNVYPSDHFGVTALISIAR